MRIPRRIVAALTALAALPAIAVAATVGGAYYAPQYDYREFWSATDNKPFQVVLEGNPFPGVDPATVAATLLPMMQSAKPRPALTFTYERPSPPPSPNYRLVLVFDPALSLNADPVCAGEPARFRPASPACSTSMRSIAGTTACCPTPRPGPTPRARRSHGSSGCSANCSWSCSRKASRAGRS